MAEATPAPPKGKKGGLLGSLSPKQKRYAAVIGGGALLALLYILMRSRGEAEPQTPSDATTATESAVPATAGGGGGETGSAFTGAESEELSERLGEVGNGLSSVNAGLSELGGGIAQVGEGETTLGTSMGENFDSLNTSVAEGQARTAAAIGANNRHLAQISKQLKNKSAKQKPNSGKAGSKHTATKHAGANSGGKSNGGGGKKSPPKKAPAKKADTPKHKKR